MLEQRIIVFFPRILKRNTGESTAEGDEHWVVARELAKCLGLTVGSLLVNFLPAIGPSGKLPFLTRGGVGPFFFRLDSGKIVTDQLVAALVEGTRKSRVFLPLDWAGDVVCCVRGGADHIELRHIGCGESQPEGTIRSFKADDGPDCWWCAVAMKGDTPVVPAKE